MDEDQQARVNLARLSPERERLLRGGFCFDSERDCNAFREILAELDAVRAENKRLKGFLSTERAFSRELWNAMSSLKVDVSVMIDERFNAALNAAPAPSSSGAEG